jgi:hypothetical protein
MIGNIQAFNDQIMREHRRALGHLPIPVNVPRAVLRAGEALRGGSLEAGGVRLPYVGRKTVRGFRYEGELFVDTSGWGSPGEPALTHDQMVRKMSALAEEHFTKGRTLYWGLTLVGQFQGYLGYWSRHETEDEV